MKNKKYKFKIFNFLTILILSYTISYTIEVYTPKGRSVGDSFVSYSMDVESLVYNPADSAWLSSTQLILEYEDLLPGIKKDLSLNRHLLGIVFPMKISNNNYSLGASIFQFKSEIYQEDMFCALASKDITSLLVKDIKKLDEIKIALGLRAKYLSISYPFSNLLSNDPIFNYGREKSVLSFDIGVSYVLKETYYYGLLVNDIFEPNVGLKDNSFLKRKIVLGFAYRYPLTNKDIVLFPSLGVRNYFNRTDLSLGVEVNFKENYFIRATYSSWNTALGLDYNYKDTLYIDYSYVILSELDTIGGHYVSLSYKISSSKNKPYVKEEVEKKQKESLSVENNKTIEKETKTSQEKKTTDTKPSTETKDKKAK